MAVTAPVQGVFDSEIPSSQGDTGRGPLATSLHARGRLSSEALGVAADMLSVVEFFVILIAAFAGTIIPGSAPPLGEVALGALLVPLILRWAGLYRLRGLASPRGAAVVPLCAGGILAAACIALHAATGAWPIAARQAEALWLLTSVALLSATRLSLAIAIAGLIRRGTLRDAVAILGAGPLAVRLGAHLSAAYASGEAPCPIEVVGIFDDRIERARFTGQTVSGTIDDLMQRGQQGRFDRVIVTLPCSADGRLTAIRDRLQALSIDVLLCPEGSAFEASLHRHGGFAGLPLLTLATRPLHGWSVVAKRVEDILISLAAVLFFGPLMGFIAIAVKLDSPGPALFRQRRHGLNNREIEVFKFRTMRVETTDQAGGRQTARDDARITRLGRLLRRTSLDELPQLLNVLKGDMSLVGPRPHPIGMRTQNRLCHEIVSRYAHRHRVKPGLTGWAQINGYRGATNHPDQLARRIEHDLCYIENWSLALDLKILLQTPITLVTTDSAF